MPTHVLRNAVSRALLATSALAIFSACDPSTVSAPDVDAAMGTYSAQVTGGSSPVALSGTAEASFDTDGVAFAGTFQNYPLGRGDLAGFHFTHIRLRGADGGGLVLGRVAPNAALPNGSFGIEEGRDLRPPYDFVARYFERSADGRLQQVAAREGRVVVRSSDTQLNGRFDLTLSDGRKVTGQFSALTRR